MDIIDLELEALSDPPLPSEYLSKRVTQLLSSVNLNEDQSLKNTLDTLELDQNFIQTNLVNKSKQYDHLPLAYNASLVTNQLKHD